MRIAIMQPYYYPYAGYFRLFAATDLFVIFDSCQWNRRGRVHRYEKNGKWVTLPIKKTNRDTTRIMDMQWQDGKDMGLSPVDYIIATMKKICCELELPFNCIKSSEVGVDSKLRGQNRIIAICKKLGATEYVNSPGGRSLYEESAFAKEGVKLTFLPDWVGNYNSIVARLDSEKSEDIKKEIYEQI